MRLPFDHGAAAPLFAGKPRTTLDSALIRVELEGGTVGWGEAYGADLPALASIVANRIAPLAIGRDALDATLGDSLARALHLMGRSGPVVHGLSGLDIALWDLRGKLEGVPVHGLLGGARRSWVPAYASLLQYYDDAEAIGRNVNAALADGYGAIKLHEKTVAAVALTRDCIGPDMPLMVDVNCAWGPDQAIDVVRQMQPSNPLWVEEPVWPPENLGALRALRDATPVAVAAGENASSVQELLDAIERRAVDYSQPSAIKVGGITALHRIALQCGDGPVKLAPHSAYFGPGFLATLHVLAAHAAPVTIERIWCHLGFVPYRNQLVLCDGGYDVPVGPGLGFDPDPELIAGPFVRKD